MSLVTMLLPTLCYYVKLYPGHNVQLEEYTSSFITFFSPSA